MAPLPDRQESTKPATTRPYFHAPAPQSYCTVASCVGLQGAEAKRNDTNTDPNPSPRPTAVLVSGKKLGTAAFHSRQVTCDSHQRGTGDPQQHTGVTEEKHDMTT